jgi:hypothetical protein
MDSAARTLGYSLTLASMLLLACGCGDSATDAADGDASVSLDEVWPNDDGRSWSFDLAGRKWSQQAVPTAQPIELPSSDALWIELWSTPTPEPDASCSATLRLRFDGMLTTDSGVTAQNLTESIDPPLPAGWRSLTFLHGCAWERTDAWIGGYGDVDRALAWVFLDAGLRRGHHFAHAIAPTMDPDLMLHGWVRAIHDFELNGGEYLDCIEVLYCLDFGVQAYGSEDGGQSGYVRPYHVGVVVYAPGIGPIFARELRQFVSGVNTMSDGRLELFEAMLIAGKDD